MKPPKFCEFRNNRPRICRCGAFIKFSFLGVPCPTPASIGVKFGVEEFTFDRIHAKFHPHRCNVSPLQGQKPVIIGSIVHKSIAPVFWLLRERFLGFWPPKCCLNFQFWGLTTPPLQRYGDSSTPNVTSTGATCCPCGARKLKISQSNWNSRVWASCNCW